MHQRTVVFIDDDEGIIGPFIEQVKARLVELGYAVLPLLTRVDRVGLAPHPVSIAVCDVAPRVGPEGEAAVRYLTARGWSVLLLSGQAPEEQVLEAIAAGAKGYIIKSESPQTVVEAITVISAGGRHLSTELAHLFYKDLHVRRPPASPELPPYDRQVLAWFVQGRLGQAPEALRMQLVGVQDVIRRIFDAAVARRIMFRLSDREREVVKMVGCRGATANQVASELHMSRNTVNTHLSRIREKYLACHPHIKDVTPRAAAQFWAKDLNLCHQEINHE
ncbi:MAG: LuxR C-terminal-related transcriptional regulator [Streptosporangiaceae bacterium]|jgi:DNA-binding NarL/FixJ family response regulator